MKNMIRIPALILSLLMVLCACAMAAGNMDASRCDSGDNFGVLVYLGSQSGAVGITADGEEVPIKSSLTYNTTGEGTSWIYLIDTKSVYVQQYSPVAYFVNSLIEKQGKNDNMALFYNGKSGFEFSMDKETAASLLTTKEYTELNSSACSLGDTLTSVLTGIDAAENARKHICLVLVTGGTADELPDDIVTAIADRDITVYTVVMRQKSNQAGAGTAEGAVRLAESSFGGMALTCEWTGNNDTERGACTRDTMQAIADNETTFVLVETESSPAALEGKEITVSAGGADCVIRQAATQETKSEPTVAPESTVTAEPTATVEPTSIPSPTAVPFPRNLFDYITDLSTGVKIAGCTVIVLIIVVVILLVRKAIKKPVPDPSDDGGETTGPDGGETKPEEPVVHKGEQKGPPDVPVPAESIVAITLVPVGKTKGGNIEFELSGSLSNGVMVGRDGNRSDVVISATDMKMSGRHAAFSWMDGQLLLTDADTTNGTYVNGEKITKPVALSENDRIGFGPISVYTVRWTQKYH